MSINKSGILFSAFFSFLLFFSNIQAQIKEVSSSFDEFRKSNYQEKIYITTDREFYVAGEILWFKVYNLEVTTHTNSTLSKIAYVELMDGDSVPQLQAKISIKNGVGEGSFYIPTSLKSGGYYLRGYTNWMKNESAALYFQKGVTIINTFRMLAKNQNPERLEMAFFPEGGHMVGGIKSRIAFQGLNEKGIGANFKGWVLGQSNDTLLSFASAHKGMGTFEFTPQPGQQYKIVANSNDKNYYFRMPEVKQEGYVIKQTESDGKLKVEVFTNYSDREVHLLIHNKNIVTCFQRQDTDNGKTIFEYQKEKLKDGINHITLFDRSGQPVCERLYFKFPDSENIININKSAENFERNNGIDFTINASRNSNLSVSVYKLDSLNKIPDSDILSYLWLTSDLRGNIENPRFYFENDEGEKWMDLVMMTHGWSRFSWDEVLNDNHSYKKFAPEMRGHIIQGKVINKSTKNVQERVETYLSVADKRYRFLNSRSDDLGIIKFELVNFVGFHNVYLSFDHTKDSIYRFDISDPFSQEMYFSSFSIPELDERYEETLLGRSLAMQTLNLYNKNELNSFGKINADTTLFFDEGSQVYHLDDYTRFTTMEDVMREYVPNVWVRTKDKSFYYRIMDAERDMVYKNPPLVLYDAIPVFSVDKIMDVDPLKVKRMDVVSTRYFFGKQTFDGIVSYTSYEGGGDGFKVDPNVLLLEYEGCQKERIFYSPTLEDIQNKNIPNNRNLLYWTPSLQIQKGVEKNVSFYAANDSGKYLIVVEGISDDGIPGFTTATFEVK